MSIVRLSEWAKDEERAYRDITAQATVLEHNAVGENEICFSGWFLLKRNTFRFFLNDCFRNYLRKSKLFILLECLHSVYTEIFHCPRVT